jgi:hypothetical protein
MKIRTIGFVVAPLVVLGAVLPRVARADDAREGESSREGGGADIGLDIDGATLVDAPRPRSGATLSGGNGFKVRVGREVHVPFVRLVPEVGYGYQHFFPGDVVPSYAWHTHRLFAGARLGIGEIIVPAFYGHIGYGWRTTDDPTVAPDRGVTLDVGFALDLRIIPHVGFGGHLEYGSIGVDTYGPRALAVGLQADVAF